jgi:hypothetical protein
MVVFCSYENQTGFEGGRVDRCACSDFDRLLLLADDRSAFLPLGAGCTDWVCGVDRRVCHLVDHFIYRPYTIATITSCTECCADQVDHLTSRLNRH